MFRAILIEKTEKGSTASLQQLDEARLPDGDITIRISHSTLNYKDALAITGRGPVVRTFPMVPGIDLAGVVTESRHSGFKPGDEVLLNGFGVGELHWGGLAELARVRGDWLIPIPEGMSAEQAMSFGTAGYTAMLCLMALEHQGVTPDKGEVIVTGATGGVGSVALQILHQLGYRTVASTRRMDETEHLKALGADDVLDAKTLSSPGAPLQKMRFAGAIDSVGSHVLANLCAQMKENGVVAACGLAQGMDFPATVAPFILRGISLIGINSVTRPLEDRRIAWGRLAKEVDPAKMAAWVNVITLDGAIAAASDLLDGRVRGRLVVAMR